MFPDYVRSDAYIEKFTRTMMTFQAYAREIDYWKHLDHDFIALGHANLNVDNAYFWRDEHGKL
ncbi:CPK2, partial [Symbiodinium necroappetens]